MALDPGGGTTRLGRRRGIALIAVTLGDPTGIGPEVALRALAAGAAPGNAVLLLGDPVLALETCERLGLALRLVEVDSVADARRVAAHQGSRLVAMLRPEGSAPLSASQRRPGRPNLAAAGSAFAAVCTAARLALAGEVDAICTAPLAKEWLARAGLARTGHTEILAGLARAPRVRLMMAVDDLRVVLATSHLALRDVPGALRQKGIFDTIAATADHLSAWWRIRQPRIAVAALNPHASDGGVYGDEEARLIAPAIRRARAAGIRADGPFPADALFSAMGPTCDGIVAMYHDQGLIPIKQRDVHRAVNITLGLPFIRTSPDHGTAFDRAGRGTADPRSMVQALELAATLATAAARPGGHRPRRG